MNRTTKKKQSKFDKNRERLIQLREEGLGSKRIARELGISTSTVALWLDKVGMRERLDNYKPIPKRKEEVINVIVCAECGEGYSTMRAHTKFCSESCRGKHNKRNNGPVRECEQCKHLFNSYSDKRWCSVECRRNHASEKKQKKEERLDIKRKARALSRLANSLHKASAKAKICQTCNREFIRIKGKTGTKYCSEECSAVSVRESKNRSRISKDKRWTMNGKADYSITVDALYERDEGLCYLCDNPTDYNDYVITSEGYFIAGEGYPSIDHVLPIVRGGLHQWGNVRLTHRGCNSKKSDRVI